MRPLPGSSGVSDAGLLWLVDESRKNETPREKEE